jgi:hypothetical protein
MENRMKTLARILFFIIIANIRNELERHRWVEGYREVRALNEKREVLKCGNCAKIWYATQAGDPPVTGCISDLDLCKMGTSMQQDQLERDFRGGLYR